MSNAKGVTLFETLIALLVAGFFATAAIPPIYRAQQELRFGAIAYRVRSQLHRIRILSIARDQDCRFAVLSPTSYRIECETPAWVTLETHELPPGFGISANARPEFHPLGNVGPMATIRIQNEDGKEKRVIVSRSGRVRMESD